MADSSPASQLVVVGSSAGGIEALMTLVSTLPAEFPAPLVVAQHLDPSRPSHLEELLARRSTLPVRTVMAQEPLEKGVVYVVPANQHVQITDHHVAVMPDGGGRHKPSIDLLFQSAASVYGEGLIAVVLTGLGSDGAAGARRVKEAGGTVVIQNPHTASFPAMPRALAPTTVDVVTDIDALGMLLHDLLVGAYTPREPQDNRQQRALLADVHQRSGVDFSRYKLPTIQRRLQRRLLATGTHTLDEYQEFLARHPEEYDRLINSFLIKVTEFFRDSELFALLRAEVLPAAIAAARTHDHELRIWSAGCATGEEAYSLALLVADLLGGELPDFTVRIFATDLDGEAIGFARRGVYPTTAVADVPSPLVERYFERRDGTVEVRKEIRGLVVFGEHDLGRRAPFPRIDLVLCRNVLIYFTAELQQRALELFAYSLRDGGFLVLGKAESTSALPAHFVPLQTSLRLYRRAGNRTALPLPREGETRLPARRGRAQQAADGDTAGPSRPDRPGDTARHDAESVLLDLPLGVVIVDRRYDIVLINAAARRLLAIHRLALGEDLIHLTQSVPPDLLRGAIDTAFGGQVALVEEVPTQKLTPGETRYLHLTARPRPPARGDEGVHTVVITIDDTTAITAARLAARAEAEAQSAEASRLALLVEQLSSTNRALLAANEELSTGNLHLRTSNEEYLLGNEEIQASSEEVETLNEELQATNEELETLNEEQQATVEELEATNEELRVRQDELHALAESVERQSQRLVAILASLSDAVIVLDSAGNTVFANPTYTRLFGPGAHALIPGDAAGQPLPLPEWPQQRLWRGESFQMRVMLRDLGGLTRRYEVSARLIADGEPQSEGILVMRAVDDLAAEQNTGDIA